MTKLIVSLKLQASSLNVPGYFTFNHPQTCVRLIAEVLTTLPKDSWLGVNQVFGKAIPNPYLWPDVDITLTITIYVCFGSLSAGTPNGSKASILADEFCFSWRIRIHNILKELYSHLHDNSRYKQVFAEECLLLSVLGTFLQGAKRFLLPFVIDVSIVA